jgi:hypothetical protein
MFEFLPVATGRQITLTRNRRCVAMRMFILRVVLVLLATLVRLIFTPLSGYLVGDQPIFVLHYIGNAKRVAIDSREPG